jgi:PAS domain S-box-containing protein
MKQAKTKKASAEKKKKTGEKGQEKREKKLRVLILEDNPADAELMERQLKKAGIGFVSHHVDTRNGFLKALKSFKPDFILADYMLPKFDALQALALRSKNAPLTPFIVVTGSISEEIAVKCMKQGADDYLLKDRLARLGEAVRNSLANRRLQAEKKAAEEALHEMNEIFQLFLKYNPIYVFIKDENIRSIYLSENYEKMLGRPLAEILGKNMDELFPSDLSRTMIEDDKKLLREGKPSEFIEELNGRTYSTLKFPISIQGKAKYLAGYTTDITEHKQTEDALQENQVRLKAFMDFVPSLILIKDHELRPIFANEAMRQNFPIDQWLGKKPHELFAAGVADLMAGKDNEALEKGFAIYEEDWIDRFGQQRFFLTQKFRIDRPNKEPLLGAIISDISERKQAENRLKASLLEKEVLLKEIHHRVKNNLQVISGLLTLQAAQINDERLQRLIKDSQSRIWTMALIHQTLYQSGNLADIDMADYIRSLAGNLLSSQARIAMPPTVSFDLLPVRLVIDKAIPLALIINELLTNAMKHAFPDGRPGEIRISLQEDGHDPAYELVVADNGAGMPSGFDPGSQKSLGLQLVAMLAKQLNGSLAFASSGGTSVHIKFSNNEKSEKQS